jgi:hypothetical protein
MTTLTPADTALTTMAAPRTSGGGGPCCAGVWPGHDAQCDRRRDRHGTCGSAFAPRQCSEIKTRSCWRIVWGISWLMPAPTCYSTYISD